MWLPILKFNLGRLPSVRVQLKADPLLPGHVICLVAHCSVDLGAGMCRFLCLSELSEIGKLVTSRGTLIYNRTMLIL